jgi:hypothetical protein
LPDDKVRHDTVRSHAPNDRQAHVLGDHDTEGIPWCRRSHRGWRSFSRLQYRKRRTVNVDLAERRCKRTLVAVCKRSH